MKLYRLNEESKKYLPQLKDVRDLKILNDKVKTFIDNPNNIAYFAIEKEKVIGFVWAYILDRIDSEPMMYIHSVDVIPEYRNQGVGKKIVSKFIEICEEKNLRNSFLITDAENIPANKLYTALGGEKFSGKVLYIFKK